MKKKRHYLNHLPDVRLHEKKNTHLIQCNTPGQCNIGIIDNIITGNRYICVREGYLTESYRSEMMLRTSLVLKGRSNGVMKVFS